MGIFLAASTEKAPQAASRWIGGKREVWETHSFGLGPAYGSLDERVSSFDIGRELVKEAIIMAELDILDYAFRIDQDEDGNAVLIIGPYASR